MLIISSLSVTTQP